MGWECELLKQLGIRGVMGKAGGLEGWEKTKMNLLNGTLERFGRAKLGGAVTI